MSEEKTLWDKLKEPFKADDIEWRLSRCGTNTKGIWGIALAYVTNRAIQNRLDEVVGPDNWKNEFQLIPSGGALCGISIRVKHSDNSEEWITKWDGSDNSDIEATKGGLSGAMKRAAVQFGIGRYLYNLTESFVNISENGKMSGKTKEGKWFKWDPPSLPAWALPVDPKLEELKNGVLDYINSGIIKDKAAHQAKMYIDTNNKDGLQRTIDWCKKQENAA